MRVRIVVSYVPRYRHGHGCHFVPPVTGLHLAALTPAEHEVEVVHEQVRPVPLRADVDLVALSFFSGFARRAYAVADHYRSLGVKVVVGGPHASYWPEEARLHADAVVVGEAESVWARVLDDAARGKLAASGSSAKLRGSVYRGEASPLSGLPTPRYDLLERRFVVRRVLQATRGCPFTCSFCSVPDYNPGFRVRPIEEVLRDVVAPAGSVGWLERLVWFWDDNLLVKRAWAKRLLSGMAGLGRSWLTQASIDIVDDPELMRLMERSGCVGIFLGIESLSPEDLVQARKRQNHVERYREAIAKLHDRGICVMAGFISGFDDQTPASIVATAEGLDAIGVDVPFLSVLTPFRGTPLYDELLRDDRILLDRDWPFYNGYNVAFRPARMTPEELHDAHRALWRAAFSPRAVAGRLARGARTLSAGGALLSAAMNGFYGTKRLVGNEPADAAGTGIRIDHAVHDGGSAGSADSAGSAPKPPRPALQPLRVRRAEARGAALPHRER
jgi:radical SAM superfamily enzyme YgiQ (UPF0313 family)